MPLIKTIQLPIPNRSGDLNSQFEFPQDGKKAELATKLSQVFGRKVNIEQIPKDLFDQIKSNSRSPIIVSQKQLASLPMPKRGVQIGSSSQSPVNSTSLSSSMLSSMPSDFEMMGLSTAVRVFDSSSSKTSGPSLRSSSQTLASSAPSSMVSLSSSSSSGSFEQIPLRNPHRIDYSKAPTVNMDNFVSRCSGSYRIDPGNTNCVYVNIDEPGPSPAGLFIRQAVKDTHGDIYVKFTPDTSFVNGEGSSIVLDQLRAKPTTSEERNAQKTILDKARTLVQDSLIEQGNLTVQDGDQLSLYHYCGTNDCAAQANFVQTLMEQKGRVDNSHESSHVISAGDLVMHRFEDASCHYHAITPLMILPDGSWLAMEGHASMPYSNFDFHFHDGLQGFMEGNNNKSTRTEVIKAGSNTRGIVRKHDDLVGALKELANGFIEKGSRDAFLNSTDGALVFTNAMVHKSGAQLSQVTTTALTAALDRLKPSPKSPEYKAAASVLAVAQQLDETMLTHLNDGVQDSSAQTELATVLVEIQETIAEHKGDFASSLFYSNPMADILNAIDDAVSASLAPKADLSNNRKVDIVNDSIRRILDVSATI